MGVEVGTVLDVRLRECREQQRLSRDALAALAGIAPSTIYKLERGRGQRPQPRVARLLAAALGVEPDAIDELRDTYIPPGVAPTG
jgi:transcriptional regulator with XRE-family HTH domain